ncbi:phosphopantetheine-binding protein [Streptomyces sp. NPDC020983]|uniref:phosphopantetheine-binding protein n=1 Tax=Streptomyces sp. NPDC020983 TaxID=3365106 RepID=UPI00379D4EA4
MNTLDDFLTLIHDELGLAVTPEEATRPLDEVAAWDSVHLLALLTVLEQRTGRALSLPDVLEAPTLERIHALTL